MIEEALKKYSDKNFSLIDNEEYYLDFFLEFDFFGTHEINFIFDDFNVESEIETIIQSIDAVIANKNNYQETVFDLISKHIQLNYKILINKDSFKRGDIVPASFHYTPTNKFGTFCIGFEGSFEEEHGAGVIVTDWKASKTGLADICMSRF